MIKIQSGIPELYLAEWLCAVVALHSVGFQEPEPTFITFYRLLTKLSTVKVFSRVCHALPYLCTGPFPHPPHCTGPQLHPIQRTSNAPPDMFKHAYLLSP